MPISIMSSKLLTNAFETGDFTGWPEFTRFADGTQCSILPLSVQGTTRNCYSVIAKTDDPNSRAMFLLHVTQMKDELQYLQNKFPIKDIYFDDEAGRERLGIQIDYGENIVLDAVSRPAMKLNGAGMPEIPKPPESEETAGTDQQPEQSMQEEPRRESMISRMTEKAGLRKLSRERTKQAMENMPPQDRTRFKLR